jgi:predicted thioesterase
LFHLVHPDLQLGLVGEAHKVVDANDLASAHGSGSLDVFATPAMVALMENAAASAVQALLSPGMITVGTRVDVRHLAATPAGVAVRARAELVQIEGSRLVFHVEASDPAGPIGEDSHERTIVDAARLLARARAKIVTSEQP